MISKQSFSQVAKRIRRTSHGLRDPQLMHPDREWGIGLAVMLIIFAVSAVWSAQSYLKYRSASVNVTEPVVENVQVYREVLVDTALANFSERQLANGSFMKKAITEDVEEGVLEEGEVTVSEEGEGEVEEGVATTTEDVVEEETATTSEEVVE